MWQCSGKEAIEPTAPLPQLQGQRLRQLFDKQGKIEAGFGSHLHFLRSTCRPSTRLEATVVDDE